MNWPWCICECAVGRVKTFRTRLNPEIQGGEMSTEAKTRRRLTNNKHAADVDGMRGRVKEEL